MENCSVHKGLAFIFPGQGSQKIGMLAELAKKYSVITETYSEASDVLSYDLWDLSQNGTKEEIMLTECTQPLLLTASVALWKVWRQEGGPLPELMAGHSLGEWSALVCSEVVEFKDAVRLVRNRGAYMQEAVPLGEGAMAAIIGLDDKTIKSICRESCQYQEVTAVNFNSPGQVVIAGNLAAVNRAMVSCKEAGAKRALSIPVSAPFHTGLMKPAAQRLSEDIGRTNFSPPRVLIVHNVNAETELSPQKIKNLMIEQISRPILWVDCINFVVQKGISDLVECGAGKVLGGLCKRIDSSLGIYSTEDVTSLNLALSDI